MSLQPADFARSDHAVLDRLLADEGPHGELGYRILAWAQPRLTEADRAHLATVALTAIGNFAPLWQGAACTTCAAPALGIAPRATAAATLRATVETRVLTRLHGVEIAVDRHAVAALLQ